MPEQRLRPKLQVRRIALDTGRENVAVISRHSQALRPEVFRGFSRVELGNGTRSMLATLLITDDVSLVGSEELGLAEPAFRRFACPTGSLISVTPVRPPDSLDAVRSKILGHTLDADDVTAIINDIAHFRYSDMEIAAFLVGSASFMTSSELLALTRAMAAAGSKLRWDQPIVVDKHCIGGIPRQPNIYGRCAHRCGSRPDYSEDLVARDYFTGRHCRHDGGIDPCRHWHRGNERDCKRLSRLPGVGRPREPVPG